MTYGSADPPTGKDLGAVEGPLLVFGGPYGNVQATAALLEEAERLGIGSTDMICTGDTVAYCADPVDTVAILRRSGVHVIMGNCEESLALEATDCGCGFEPGTVCAVLADTWYTHARDALDDDAKRWMAGLPRRLDFHMAERHFAVVHGAVSTINRFVFASTAAAVKSAEIAASGADAVVGGHCGLPFSEFVGDKLWHNPGVIGLPANDGTRRAWYSLLVPRDGGIAIEHRSFGFDTDGAAHGIESAGLPAPYAETLRSGLWHSCEILPPRETADQGIPLPEHSRFWAGPDQSR